MKDLGFIKSFIIFLCINFYLLFSPAYADFNEKDEDFAFEYYIELIMNGGLPISNFIHINDQWQPCHYKECVDKAESNLIQLLESNNGISKKDRIRALVLEKELRRLQTFTKTDFKGSYISFKRIEPEYTDLFKDDFFELGSFYAYFGGFSQKIDKKSNEYLKKSLGYFKSGLKDEFGTDRYSNIDWEELTSDSDIMWLYTQKIINDFTYANTALIMDSISRNNRDYLNYKNDLINLFSSLPKSLMWQFETAEDYYLHMVGPFEYASFEQTSNVDGMRNYLDQWDEYCIRTKAQREYNKSIIDQDNTTDYCRSIDLNYARLFFLEGKHEEGTQKVQKQFESFENMLPYDQLILLRLMIDNSIYSLISIKDLYETAITIGSKMGLAEYGPEIAYWTIDYLYLLRMEQGIETFFDNENNLLLLQNAQRLLNSQVVSNSLSASDPYIKSILFYTNASIAEFDYYYERSDENADIINALIDQAQKDNEMLIDWRSKEVFNFLTSSLIHYYLYININYEKANSLVDNLLSKDPNSIIQLDHKANVCKEQKKHSCVTEYANKSIALIEGSVSITKESDVGSASILNSRRLFEMYYATAPSYRALQNPQSAREYYLKALKSLAPLASVKSDDLVEASFNSISENSVYISDSINQILTIDNEFGSRLDHEEFETLFIATQFLQNSNLSKAIVQMTDRMKFSNGPARDLYKYKQDLEIQIAQVRKQINDYSLTIVDPESSKKLTNDFNILKKELRKTNLSLKSYSSYHDQISLNKFVSLSELQMRLQNNEVILIFNQGKDFSFSWLVSKDNYIITPLINYDFKENIKSIRASIQNQGLADQDSFDHTIAENLYQILLEPVEDDLKNKDTLFILANGDLMRLPLDILPDKKSFNSKKNNWLIKKYSIINLPNINLINERKNEKKDYDNFTFLGIGDPILSNDKEIDKSLNEIIAQKDFLKKIFRNSKIADLEELKQIPELPETSQELELVASYFKSRNVDLMLRKDASETKLKRLKLDEYNILSFATHTIPSIEDGKYSEPGLILSLPNEATTEDDGILTSSEITQMNLNADLVVLSACDTAQNIKANNNISGLIDSFIYAGSKAIIASHWPVETNSTVKVITKTFDYWMDTGLSLDKALRRAKLDLMSDKNYSNPLFWASFSVYGSL
jgi:CHAT domain-containing protein